MENTLKHLRFWQLSLHSMKHFTGYIRLGHLESGMNHWFFTAGREFGLWYLTIHARFVKFEIIGPFKFRKEVN